MADDERAVLVVGAGPTGLAAALLLAQRGVPVRVVEKRTAPSVLSKAFGINPRTLTLLQESGVTERLLAQGRRATGFNFWRRGKRLFRVDLSEVEHRFPFMCVLSQAETEATLETALKEAGVTVQRGVTFEAFEDANDCRARLRHMSGEDESCRASAVLGADGAHSAVRESLAISFEGESYDKDWYLCDLELDVPLNHDEAHAFLLDDGVLFMIRIGARVWRIVSNRKEATHHLPAGSTTGAVVWESDFRISHRIARRFQVANVCLAGDAAHIHSPLGGRGMNLGIEDAYVFAELFAHGRLREYHELRYETDARVVRQVARLTEIPRGKSWLAKGVRVAAPALRHVMPLAEPYLRPWVLGLDHEVCARIGANGGRN